MKATCLKENDFTGRNEGVAQKLRYEKKQLALFFSAKSK
jgi:hypothetical protein